MYYPLDEQTLEILKSKSNLKSFTIYTNRSFDIPIKNILQFLSIQKNLRRLTISRDDNNKLLVGIDLSIEHIFLSLHHLDLVNIKLKKKNFQTIIKCFPNISSLYLNEIEFICYCSLMSTLCVDCSYQCFNVMTRFGSLRKLELNSCNFRIRCESLEKFNKLCRIYILSKVFDFESFAEEVKQLCLSKNLNKCFTSN